MANVIYRLTLILCFFIGYQFIFSQTCEIGDLQVEISPCDSQGMYTMQLDFEYVNVTDSFVLVIGFDQVGTFAYTDLPVLVGTFMGDSSIIYSFLVYDYINFDCARDALIGPIICPPTGDCAIVSISSEVGDCDENNLFNIFLSVQSQFASDSFDLFVFGNYFARFAYKDVPIQIGPFFGDGVTDIFVLVRDSEDEECLLDYIIPAVDCEENRSCTIRDLVAENRDCDSEGNYDIEITFTPRFVGSSYQVWVQDTLYGVYSYAVNPLVIGSFRGDGQGSVKIEIRDLEDQQCSATTSVPVPRCESGTDCRISQFVVTPLPCNEEGRYEVDIFIVAVNASTRFGIVINQDEIGPFNYADIPIRLGTFLGDGIQSIRFIAFDWEDTTCVAEFLLPPVDCGLEVCKVRPIVVETGPCSPQGVFSARIYAGVENPSFSQVDIIINGIYRGRFDIQNLPVVINNIESRASEYQLIRVCVANDPDCCADHEFLTSCCPVVTPRCLIENPRYRIWCDREDRLHFLIDFDASGPLSRNFSVRQNGVNIGTFPYSDRPLILGPYERRTQEYEFVIRDSVNQACNTVLVIREMDCDFSSQTIRLDNQDIEIWSFGKTIYTRGLIHTGYTMSVYSLDGRLIHQGPLSAPDDSIRLDRVISGYYIAVIANNTGSQSVKLYLGD